MGFSHFTNLSLESVYVHYVKGRFIPKMHLEVRGWLEDGGGCDDAQLCAKVFLIFTEFGASVYKIYSS